MFELGFNMKNTLLILLLSTFIFSTTIAQEKVNPKEEYIETLTLLCDALLTLQITENTNSNCGALQCNYCNVFHTRSGEAVFPFAYLYEITHEKKYLDAALSIGDWLIKYQNDDGAWEEGATKWKGTTNDILLMMCMAYPILYEKLTDEQKIKWQLSIKKSADFLVPFISPFRCSINYSPTTAASLMAANEIVPDTSYVNRAKVLVDWTIAKMDEAGFIQGEGGKSFGVKYGVDILYEMDMSLGGMAIYAKLNNDKEVEDIVRNSLKKNLNFIYPNGALEGSWGSRCNKWTTYGSKTADGSQIIFTLFADEDQRYAAASLKNSRYIRTMMKNGFLGYGPHFWEYIPEKLCNYPTFARSKAFALAAYYSEDKEIELPKIPSDFDGWYEYYPTINIVLSRSKNFMVTVTGYNYHDLTHTENGPHNQHPSGGAACNIWLKDFGFLQTSSQTEYIRGESEHMPAMDDTVMALTPRIEFINENGYFTNLYETDGRIKVEEVDSAVVEITTTGELKSENYIHGGVGYTLSHIIADDYIEKTVKINFHDMKPTVKILEPIVTGKGTKVKIISSKKALIEGEKINVLFEIIEGDFELSVGDNPDTYFFPFPSIKCYPLQIIVNPPAKGYNQYVKYRLSIK